MEKLWNQNNMRTIDNDFVEAGEEIAVRAPKSPATNRIENYFGSGLGDF